MESLSHSRSGRILEHLTGAPGLDAWISSLRASHVSRGPSPESSKANRTTEIYGPRSGVSFAKYDLATFCLRMSQVCFPGMEAPISASFSANWPRWGLMRGGAVSELPTLVRRISASGSGSLLPTPNASTYGTNQGGAAGRIGPIRPSLETMARKNLWPTPTVQDANGRDRHNQRDGSVTLSLLGEARRFPTPLTERGGGKLIMSVGRFPTPASSMVTMGDMEQARFSGNDSRRPSYRHANWPTPTATDCKRGSTGWIDDGKRGAQLPASAGGALNPRWVSWLMGWPIGWVSLEPLPSEAFSEWLDGCATGAWWDEEPDIARTVVGMKGRGAQLKALGNGQVPQCVALAWRVLGD